MDAVIPTALPNVVINGVSINPGNGQYGFAGPATDIAYNGQLNYTHTFTPKLLLELRAAYTRIDNQSNSPNSGTNAATAVGFPSNIDFGAASSGLSLINVPNFAPLGDSNFVPIHDLTNTYQYSGTVSYTIGRHSLRFGGESIRRQAKNVQSSNAVGNINGGIGGGPTRPLQVGDPHAGGHQINQWFNPQAFVIPQLGQFGNTSRNSLTGPTFEHFDLSVFKDILITERYNLELRAETFNLTNTAGYFVPNNQNDHATTNAVGSYSASGTVVPGNGFAQIVSTNPSYVPRELQLAVKFKF